MLAALTPGRSNVLLFSTVPSIAILANSENCGRQPTNQALQLDQRPITASGSLDAKAV